MKNLFFALSAFVVIGLSSCGVDCEDTTALETRIENASTAYATEASEENCKEFKSALEESLDFSDCDGATEEGIKFTEDLIDSLDC